ncbi:MAG: ParB/RepB/Spo0J family partition protein [Deltaproteobacteria bacterium]|nr:ParB/RepB/Spo0J family partition protein [Deltaproteobacteria bacterium]
MANKGKRKALGKGLGALIPTDKRSVNEVDVDGMKRNPTPTLQCPIDKLVPNKEQPRQGFDQKKLQGLTESVKTEGVIHPLIVRQHNSGYQIVAGERRWRAAKLAGLLEVPVIIKELTDAEVLELALIENIQREDLNPLEEASAYRSLIDEHGLTQEELSKKVGKQRSSVANLLRLLKLPAQVRRYLITGQISMGHARAILGVVGSAAQQTLAEKVVREDLSVRACEELVRHAPKRKQKKKLRSRQSSYSPADFRLIESLQRRLGTKVDFRRGKKGGKIVINYFSPEELDRIIEIIEGRG